MSKDVLKSREITVHSSILSATDHDLQEQGSGMHPSIQLSIESGTLELVWIEQGDNSDCTVTRDGVRFGIPEPVHADVLRRQLQPGGAVHETIRQVRSAVVASTALFDACESTTNALKALQEGKNPK